MSRNSMRKKINSTANLFSQLSNENEEEKMKRIVSLSPILRRSINNEILRNKKK
jgi:hypothetical protein